MAGRASGPDSPSPSRPATRAKCGQEAVSPGSSESLFSTAPGTIDPGYRNEIRVLLINHGQEPYTVRPGDRIAQLVIGAYSAVRWRVEESLAESRRGQGGFGSTGA